MPEKIMPGPLQDSTCCRESTCIHTRKIFDSCQSKDCIEDLRLYLTSCSQAIADRALSLRANSAELLYVYINVEPVGFNRGFYTIDLRYFYRITADAFVGAARPTEIVGLAVFDKRAVLFGSESCARVFSSRTVVDGLDYQNLIGGNLPIAVVEAVDPILLNIKLVDPCTCPCHCCEGEITEIPPAILSLFDGDLVLGDNGSRRVYVTLGQFTLLRLERDTQLLIPFYDYCMPEKECDGSGCCSCDKDPCELFQQVQFPVKDFFPPTCSGGIEPQQPPKHGCCK